MKKIYFKKWNYVIAFFGLLMLFSGKVYAYTAPTVLRVIWQDTGGTDQSATCHRYGDYITNVTFAGINKTTGTNGATLGTPDYGWHFDYGRTTPQVTPGEVKMGQTYPISITVAVTTPGDFQYQYLAVYIDWNQNNTIGSSTPYLLDVNENPIFWNNYNNSGTTQTLTGNITVPTGINPGSIYMRVALTDNDPRFGDWLCAVGWVKWKIMY